MKAFFKKYGVYLAAAVLFVLASIIYCFPALEGKVLHSGDNINANCAAAEESYFTQQTGEVSWWCDSMFSGMPSYQIKGGQYKADHMLSPLRSLLHRGHYNPIWALILYFCCFFLLFLSLDIDKWLSIAGSFALTLSSYFIIIIATGHNTKTSAIALMCAVLAGFFFLLRGKYGIGIFVTLVASAVGITTHPQMTYYVFMLIGLLWLVELPGRIREKKMKGFLVATAVFAGCVGTGLLANSSSIFANSEYVKETVRGGSGEEASDVKFVTSFSYSPLESFSLLIPGVMGGSSQAELSEDSHMFKTARKNTGNAKLARDLSSSVPLYWGGQPFTAGNVYVGAIVCFLFLLGLLLVRGPLKWGLGLATLFSLLLALGSHVMPLTKLFMLYFPLYSKFRAVSTILLVAQIAMPLLGFLGLQAVLDGSIPKKKALRSIYIAAGVTAGICLLFALIGPSVFSFKAPADSSLSYMDDSLYAALIADRKALLVRDSLRSAAFILAAAFLLFFFLWDKKGRLKRAWVMAAVGALVVLDLWLVDRRFLSDSNFVTPKENSKGYTMKDWEKTLQNVPGFFRVFNNSSGENPFSEARTSLYLKSVGGYNAAKLKRYQDIIDQHLRVRHMPVYGMLNTKYIIQKGKDGKEEILEYPYALGNAWFVDQYVITKNDQEESDALTFVDLSNTAVVSEEFRGLLPEFKVTPDPERTVRLTSHAPNSREYDYTNSAPGTLVFSEIWYPHGWKAFIDGKPAQLFRANYVLRALNVPAGHHTVRMIFDPDSVKKGNALAVPFVVLVYLALAAVVIIEVVRRLLAAKRNRRGGADA